MHSFLSRTGLLVLLVSALAAGGCDTRPEMDYSSVGLIGAHGTITLDGQPVEGAVATFESPDGTFSYGMTDATGEYTLQFDSQMQGVTPGPKTVRISTTRKILGLNTDDAETGEVPEDEGQTLTSSAEEKIPARYNQESQLQVEVTPDQTEYNFDLRSA